VRRWGPEIAILIGKTRIALGIHMPHQTMDNGSPMSQSSFDLASYNNISTPSVLYFAAPKDFNDPFDSVTRFTYPRSRAERERFMRVWVSRSLPYLPDEVADRRVRGSVAADEDMVHMERICEQLTHQMQVENAVFCMTERRDSILMWAHYADHHTGFCLEFSTDNPLFSRARAILYRRDLPHQNLVEFLNPGPIRMPPWYLVVKAEDWAYEKEWRLADPGPGPGPREYPPESLTGVILGCRMDEKNREQIKEWCKEREPRPVLYHAREKRREFGLDIVPLSY
jgi:hypothetical protein